MAQADGPPQGSVYPTSWWEAGDEVAAVRQIMVPADAAEGANSILFGPHRRETMEHLPIWRGDGTVVPDAAIRLTELDITR